MRAKTAGLSEVSVYDIKVVSNDLRPEAEVNELILLVGSELIRLRWGEADQARRHLCTVFNGADVRVPLTPRAGIAKMF